MVPCPDVDIDPNYALFYLFVLIILRNYKHFTNKGQVSCVWLKTQRRGVIGEVKSHPETALVSKFTDKN